MSDDDRHAYVLSKDDINSIADHIAGRDLREMRIPNGSVAGLIALLRNAESEREQMRDLLGSIWLYVSWRYVTKQLPTEQKEMWANAVDAWSMAMQADDGEEPHPVAERWWRDDFVDGSDD